MEEIVEEYTVMEMKYSFSQEDYAQIKAERKKNQDKKIDKRLEVLELRCEGMSQQAIAEATGFHRSHINNLIRKYFEEGIASVAEKHYGGNHRNLHYEEEAAFLKEYQEKAESGQMHFRARDCSSILNCTLQNGHR